MDFNKYQYTLSHLTATDAYSTTLPVISGFRQDRYVGLFYFLCHNGNEPVIRRMPDLLKTSFEDIFDLESETIPLWSRIYFNEPLYGYYNSMDEWVMRKHIEQFILAGVDYLVIDFTNKFIYEKELYMLLDLLVEYRAVGWSAPWIAFYVNLEAERLTRRLYEIVYMNPKYKDVVFYGGGEKPIIISVPHELSEELKEYFDVRVSQFHHQSYDSDKIWFYMEWTRPPRLCTDVMNVSIAQMSGGAFGYAFKGLEGEVRDSWGRGNTLAKPENHNTEAIERGDNFQEAWDYAIQQDPKIIFVTGWNEWWVEKIAYYKEDGSPMYDVAVFWDTFNTEYSRDAEMTKITAYKDGEEGYGDNYYLQLAANIRRYKGLPAVEAKCKPMSIDINGDLTQWVAVQECYIAISTRKIARDCAGFAQGLHYTQVTPENFVKEVKVAHDADNLYFRIETEQDITVPKPDQRNWMNLFIGVEGSVKCSWQSFNYVINRTPGEDGVAYLEYFTDPQGFETANADEIPFRITERFMQLAIPRSMLGVDGEHFSVTFKVADSIEQQEDIMDYYVSGESFPMGRMAFVYTV